MVARALGGKSSAWHMAYPGSAAFFPSHYKLPDNMTGNFEGFLVKSAGADLHAMVQPIDSGSMTCSVPNKICSKILRS